MKNVFKESGYIKNEHSEPAFVGASARRGQAMLLAVLTIGATMLGVTTVAGLLMVYQIRQVTDFGNSAQAVFAADTGAEWSLYNQYQHGGQPMETPLPVFTNGAAVSVDCYDIAQPPNQLLCTSTSSVEAVSIGSSGNTKRAFLATFGSSAAFLP